MKNKDTASPTLGDLRQELYQTNQALRNAYDKFNYVTAPELVEASIYEINALKAAATICCGASRPSWGRAPTWRRPP
jgi:hypothetical protein